MQRVISATYLSDYKIRIEFSDGACRIVNFQNFLINNPHPQYDEYRDFAKFSQFKIERGNLVWGDEWDLIFPIDELYSGTISY